MTIRTRDWMLYGHYGNFMRAWYRDRQNDQENGGIENINNVKNIETVENIGTDWNFEAVTNPDTVENLETDRNLDTVQNFETVTNFDCQNYREFRDCQKSRN